MKDYSITDYKLVGIDNLIDDIIENNPKLAKKFIKQRQELFQTKKGYIKIILAITLNLCYSKGVK